MKSLQRSIQRNTRTTLEQSNEGSNTPSWALIVGLMIVVMLALLAGRTNAQDEALTCADDALTSLTEQTAALSEQLAGAAALTPDILTAFVDLRALSAQVDAQCTGLSFSSEEDGQQPVLGPFTLPDGLYRITLETDGYFQMDTTVLDGTCTKQSEYMPLYFSTPGTGKGAQTTLDAKGCEVLFAISLADKPWELTFENLTGE